MESSHETTTDVTDRVLVFCEAARHLWNVAFLPRADWEVRDRFRVLCSALFQALVVPHLPVVLDKGALTLEGFSAVRVLPAIVSGTPIMINRTLPSSAYWDDPVTRVEPGDLDLGLIDFFDWDELEARDFALVRVGVRHCVKFPHLIGREALLEFQHARFVLVTDRRF